MYHHIQKTILDNLPPDIDESLKRNIICEPCKDKRLGDIASNVVLVLKDKIDKEKLKAVLEHNAYIQSVEIVGPGFMNITLTNAYWYEQLRAILEQKYDYGRPNIGNGEKVIVEVVSTNPTGPLHVGHGRTAVLSDAIARLLEYAGYDVHKEYYVNDAGAQIKHLAESLWLRYREAKGDVITDDLFEKDMYPGDYLVAPAQSLASTDLEKDTNFLELYAVKAMMALITDDLKKLDITINHYISEKNLIEEGAVDQAIALLKDKDLIYTGVLQKPQGFTDEEEWEERAQMIFASSQFGDNRDRALTRSNGGWTYLAGDIGYHWNKSQRGFKHIINVFGADHIGQAKSLEIAVQAICDCQMHIKICQMVNFVENGNPLRMSKRAGHFITVGDVVDQIGPDAFRFMLLMRRPDVGFDFDLAQVVQKTKDNPLFYVQYAHARVASAKRRFEIKSYATEGIELLTHEDELSIIKLLSDWTRQIHMAITEREPHRIANYLYTLASALHTLWSANPSYRFIDPSNEALSQARFCLLEAVQMIIKTGLTILGVSAPEEM